MIIGLFSLQAETKLHNYQSIKLHFTQKRAIFFSIILLTSWVPWVSVVYLLQNVNNTIRSLLGTTYCSTNWHLPTYYQLNMAMIWQTNERHLTSLFSMTLWLFLPRYQSRRAWHNYLNVDCLPHQLNFSWQPFQHPHWLLGHMAIYKLWLANYHSR